jgi:hypothetical protein
MAPLPTQGAAQGQIDPQQQQQQQDPPPVDPTTVPPDPTTPTGDKVPTE